jgi:hypothetical protein
MWTIELLILPLFVISYSPRHKQHRSGWKTVHFYVGNSSYANEPSRWNSEYGQDATVAKLLGNKEGYFVDLAAHDAVLYSNTVSLERWFNWSGVCIEANEAFVWGLAHRRCSVYSAIVYGSKNEIVQFNPDGACGLGCGGVVGDTLDNKVLTGKEKSYATTTLLDILIHARAPHVIDYFSLDVEGAELFILQNFPFNNYVFRIISVERPKEELHSLLKSKGYLYLRDHGGYGDKMYVHESNSDLMQL